MPKTCERCGKAFDCRPDDIANCQCSGVKLSPETRQELAENYRDCLCVECLKEVQEEVELGFTT